MIPGKLKNFITGKIFTAAQFNSSDTECPANSDVLMNQGKADCFIFGVPESYKDILGRTGEALWRKAVEVELTSLADNRVWRLVKQPAGVVPLKSKWVFQIKQDESGKPVRHNARLVAKGFLQKAGKEYRETYTPVVKLVTIRTVPAVAVHRKMFKTAFLYGKLGELEEDAYMVIPEGVNCVCKLD